MKLAFLTTSIAIQHLGGPLAKQGLSARLCVLVFKASLLNYLGHPSANVCSSAKCCVLAFKASMLYLGVGGPLAKVGSSAKFHVAVFKASMFDSLGGRGPSAKVGSSAKFGVVVFKASILDYPGGSICQSMFICQVLCTGIQGKYHLSELKSLIVILGCFRGVLEGYI